jgi:peptide deformylase
VAIRKIVMHTNPRLRRKSIKVKQFDQPLQRLIDDMIDTMRDAEGVGLAAPQVGVLLRVIVCEYADEDEELHQTIMVNPEFLEKEGEWMAEEGCLSIPGYVGTVPRAVWVSVKGKDRYGKDVRIKTDGPLAHILQHEIDHLDGVLYVDYLESMDELREVDPERKRRRRPRAADEAAAGDDVAATDGDEDDEAGDVTVSAASESHIAAAPPPIPNPPPPGGREVARDAPAEGVEPGPPGGAESGLAEGTETSPAGGAESGPAGGSAAPPHGPEERSTARRRYRGSLVCGSVCPPCE